MELTTGYRHTELGVIPADWECLKLNDCLTLLTDFEANGSFADVAANVRVRESEDFAWYVRATDLEGQPGSGRRFVDKKSYEFLKKTALVGGEVLVAKRGEIGKVYWFEGAGDHANATLAPNLYLLKLNHRAEPLFVFAYLKYGKGNQALRDINASTTLGALYKKDVKALRLPVPPLPEQRAIAAALSDVDALLGALDRLVAKKRDLKQAAMQQLLTGATRLPGFSGKWEVVRFASLADRAVPWSIVGGPFGSNLKASDYADDGVRILQLQNIGDGRFLDGYSIYTSDEKADELRSHNIYPGEILLSKMGDPVARACVVPAGAPRYLMASDGIRLSVDSTRFDTRFVLDYLNSPRFRDRAIAASMGTTRRRIGLAALKALPLTVPALREQRAIANILSDMEAELYSLEQRREKTRLLKQGMMQELLAGRSRLV